MRAPTPTTPAARQPASRLGRVPKTTVLLFMLPALTLYGVFVIYPIIQSLRYSFYDWNGLEPLDNFIGLDNFRRAWSDQLFRDALSHNVIILVLSVFLQVPFALGLALLLNSRIHGRAILRTLFFAPYVLSEVVTGVVWRQILRPDGLLDQGLDAVGATGLTHEWLADPELVLYSLFFIISWKYFGFHMVIILAGLQQLPRELHEAASIDGASSWQSFGTSHCPCSDRHFASRSSCRSSVPCSCSTSSGSPPREDPSAPRRPWPRSCTTSSARGCSATPARSRS